MLIQVFVLQKSDKICYAHLPRTEIEINEIDSGIAKEDLFVYESQCV